MNFSYYKHSIYVLLGCLLFFSIAVSVNAQLEMSADEGGINYLAHNGTQLINKEKQLGWAFSAEAYKIIKKNGEEAYIWSSPIGKPQFVSNRERKLYEWLYVYNFGKLKYVCEQSKDVLFLTLTLTNSSSSDTLCGVNLIPLQFSFDKRPLGFQELYPYYHYNEDGPSVIIADYETGKFALSNEDLNSKVFTGLLDVKAYAGAVVYKMWLSNIPFIGMNTAGLPNLELRLPPHKSITYRIALRFYPSGTPEQDVAAPLMESYRQAYKQKFSWPDKRMIGALVLSSATKQNEKLNPRGWFPTQKIALVTASDRAIFRNLVLQYAQQSVSILQGMNAQGMITWDIEGQQFPHAISYVGSPDKLKQIAPEMDAVANEYFAIFKKAGFRTGICVRPQEFTYNSDSSWATQKNVSDPAAVLIRKIKYAYKRWGCTLFYIDTNMDSSYIILPAKVFEKVQKAVPGVLLIPEHQNNKYYEYTAPYEDMRFGRHSLDPISKAAYPSSFMVINTSEGIYDLQGKRMVTDSSLLSTLREGNILMFRAWYQDEPANSILKNVYEAVYGRRKINPGK